MVRSEFLAWKEGAAVPECVDSSTSTAAGVLGELE